MPLLGNSLDSFFSLTNCKARADESVRPSATLASALCAGSSPLP
jgi:hypothetical protein